MQRYDTQPTADHRRAAGDHIQARRRDFNATECLANIRRQCDLAKQTANEYRERFMGLNLKYADGQPNAGQPLTDEDKKKFADDSPILELIPTVKRLEEKNKPKPSLRMGL